MNTQALSAPRPAGLGGRIALATALVVAIPFAVNDFWVFIAIECVVFALYAATFNLLFGYGGMLPFGHAVLFGVGAYAVAILVKKSAFSALVALAIAPLAGALTAAIVAFFCVRLAGIYLGMLTFAFQMLAYTVVLKWYSLTGGDDGLSGITIAGWLGTPHGLYALSVVLTAAGIAFLWLVVRSPFGVALQAAKSNPQKSRAVGIDVARHQLLAFVISGFLAGLAGGLFALANQSVFPGWLNWTASAVPIVMTVLGGMASFWGPLVGAVIYVLLQTVLTGYTEYWALALGFLIIAIVMVMPQGVMGWFDRGRRG